MVRRRLLAPLLLAPLTACSLLDWSGLKDGAAPSSSSSSDGGPDAEVDAATGNDGGDAGLRCDPAAPFGAPVLLPGAVNTANDNELDGFLTPDELTLYFARDTGDGNSFDIHVAARADPDGPFGEARPVAGLSSSAIAETTPFLARDGTMYLTVAGSNGRGRIASARPDGKGGFQAPVEIATLSTVSAGLADPWFLADGATFYFSDAYDEIPMTATAKSGSFTTPTTIPGVRGPAGAPKVTDDDRTLFFTARPSADVESDIYVAHRSAAGQAFGGIERIAELSTGDRDQLSWVSGDGCHVVVVRRGNSTDLFLAARGR